MLASVYACLRADVDENNASMCIHVKELQNQAVLAPGDKLNPRVKPSGKTSVGELLMGPSKNNLAPKACRSSRGIGIFEPPCGNEKYTLSQFRKRTWAANLYPFYCFAIEAAKATEFSIPRTRSEAYKTDWLLLSFFYSFFFLLLFFYDAWRERVASHAHPFASRFVVTGGSRRSANVACRDTLPRRSRKQPFPPRKFFMISSPRDFYSRALFARCFFALLHFSGKVLRKRSLSLFFFVFLLLFSSEHYAYNFSAMTIESKRGRSHGFGWGKNVPTKFCLSLICGRASLTFGISSGFI